MNEKQFNTLVEMMHAIANAAVADFTKDGDTARARTERHEAIIEASIELVETEDEAPEAQDLQKLTGRQYMHTAKALAQGLAGMYIKPGEGPFHGIVSGFSASLLEQDPALDTAAFHDSVVTHHNAITGALVGKAQP